MAEQHDDTHLAATVPVPADGVPADGIAAQAARDLTSLGELPLTAHPEVYARLHEALERELAAIRST